MAGERSSITPTEYLAETMRSARRASSISLMAEATTVVNSVDNSRLYFLFADIDRDYVGLDDIENTGPSWLRPRAFIKELGLLTGPRVWDRLTANAAKYPQEQAVVQEIIGAQPETISDEEKYDVTLGTIFLGLGAIMGADFEKIVKPKNSQNTLVRAGVETAKNFSGQAATPEEAIDRLVSVYEGYAHQSPESDRRGLQISYSTQHFLQAITLLLQEDRYRDYMRTQIARGHFGRRGDYFPRIPESRMM